MRNQPRINTYTVCQKKLLNGLDDFYFAISSTGVNQLIEDERKHFSWPTAWWWYSPTIMVAAVDEGNILQNGIKHESNK